MPSVVVSDAAHAALDFVGSLSDDWRRRHWEERIGRDAYWYACGYRDFRSKDKPIIDPNAFVQHYILAYETMPDPNIPEAFKTWLASFK